jgi:hypothetical protein
MIRYAYPLRKRINEEGRPETCLFDLRRPYALDSVDMLEELPPEAKEFFRAAGRRGGKKRASKMTPAERRESARKAAQARWKKKRSKAKD